MSPPGAILRACDVPQEYRQNQIVLSVSIEPWKRRLLIVLIGTVNVLWFQPRTYTGCEGQSPRERAVHTRREEGGNYDKRREQEQR
jgi:hypothetical protein